jgi:hypothetical protein
MDFATDSGKDLAIFTMFNLMEPFHVCFTRTGRFLCQKRDRDLESLVLLSKYGCPTWIRTMIQGVLATSRSCF